MNAVMDLLPPRKIETSMWLSNLCDYVLAFNITHLSKILLIVLLGLKPL